jgi:hypothetical protein
VSAAGRKEKAETLKLAEWEMGNGEDRRMTNAECGMRNAEGGRKEKAETLKSGFALTFQYFSFSAF